jgi:hypothetical protein
VREPLGERRRRQAAQRLEPPAEDDRSLLDVGDGAGRQRVARLEVDGTDDLVEDPDRQRRPRPAAPPSPRRTPGRP